MASPYKQSKLSARALAAANRQDLAGDLTFTQNQLDAIFGNLRTTGVGLAQTLTDAQRRDLQALQRLSVQVPRKAEKRVDRTAARIATRYGSAVGPAGEQLLGPAAATAAASGKVAKGLLAQGRMTGRAGEAALAIQQSAAAEASEGAQYAMAVALKSRAQQDSAAAAQMAFELEQMKLQSQLDVQAQKELMRYSKELETEAATDLGGATELASGLAGLMPSIRSAVSRGVLRPDIPLADAMRILDIPPSLVPLFAELWPRLKSRGILTSDQGYDATVEAIYDSMVVLNPNVSSIQEALMAATLASLKSSWNSWTQSVLSPEVPNYGYVPDTAVPGVNVTMPHAAPQPGQTSYNTGQATPVLYQ